jgi:ATP-dependent Clp protease ATP-binding subunit ClpA
VLFNMGLDPLSAGDYIRHRYQDLPPAGEDQPIRYTDGIHRVLLLAQEEAAWIGHDYVGAEHLLLGLMRWQNGGAVNMLWALGISPVRVRRNVRQMLQAVHLEVGLEEARRMTNFSELALRVLNGAIEQAAQAGHATVGMEHLLLVLCQDSRNVAGRVLREMGVSVPVVQGLVHRVAYPSHLGPVIEAAGVEASRLGDHYVGTEHLLLAVTRDSAGVEVLRHLGADSGQVQRRLRELTVR